MKARIRFTHKPFFNFPPDRLICPGIVLGRAENRRLWSLVFTVTKQLSAQVYEGDLRWLVPPVEQDFGKGVRFQLISDPRARLSPSSDAAAFTDVDEGKPGDQGAGGDHGKAADAGTKKPKGAGKPGDPGGPNPPDPPGPPPNPGKPPPHPGPHPKMPHLPKDAYTRTPAAGVLAEGELLG